MDSNQIKQGTWNYIKDHVFEWEFSSSGRGEDRKWIIIRASRVENWHYRVMGRDYSNGEKKDIILYQGDSFDKAYEIYDNRDRYPSGLKNSDCRQ